MGFYIFIPEKVRKSGKNVNLKPDAPALKKAGASAGMLIKTSLTGLIHKLEGIWKSISSGK
jgi:hypothetical protein